MKIFSKAKDILKIIVNKPKYINMTKNIDFNEKNIYLLNTPEHGNLGDQMIALATIKFLKKYFDKYNIVEITHDHFKYSKNILKRKIKNDALIIVHGGGYLGDLWEEEQKNFCEIIETFYLNKIIAFPQTVYFSDNTKINYYREKINKYKNLRIFVRENNSYRFLIDNKFCDERNVFLVPDIVLSYPELNFNTKRENILICARRDKEKITSLDKIKVILEKEKILFDQTDTVIDCAINISKRDEILKSKLFEFSKYKLVITDRLHGMIFAYLTNTPCIAFDNISKKVSGVYQWISHSNCITCFSKFDEYLFLSELDRLLNLKEKQIADCNEYFEVLKKTISDTLNKLEGKI